MGFLGVYKAIYDYAPQSDNELAIKEGDVLYILEKSGEDDWWKAKKKAIGEDDDEPTGLIPNNYVEEAIPTHQARALYDYTRQTDEELSFTEDSRLDVYDTSDPDWILVGLGDEYGFAPANYIEMQDAGTTSSAAAHTPNMPQRPALPERNSQSSAEPASSQSSTQQGPAAALAGIMHQRKTSNTRPVQYTPEASEDEETLSPVLPARPTSQNRPTPIDTQNARDIYGAQLESPGIRASPPYNRALDRGIDEEVARHSPGGFHMYNINEMVSVMGKRKKMPTTLGINIATGVIMIAPEKSKDGPEQKWTAEKMTHYSIEGKHIFMELVRPSKSVDFHAGAKDTAQEIVAALGEMAGAVRAEGLREVIMAGSGQEQKKGQVLYDFMAQGDDEVTVAVGDEVVIIDDVKSEEWWQVRRLRNGKEGVVPSSYIEITGTIQAPSRGGVNAGKSTVEQNRLEEERLAKESLKAARREEDHGSEVGPGMRLPERGSSLAARDNGNTHAQQKSRRDSTRQDGSGQSKSSKSKPDASKVRTWTDRSKSFSVEAQFLALKDGKINLHKMNGVKIAVPVQKMSVEDLEYVERITGVSLDEDKPLSDIKKKQQRTKESGPSGGAGATIERSQKPEYDWFQFFLSCDVAVGLCERYAQAFVKDSMDESVLPDIDAAVLRNLGIREGDIIKCMRFLDKKFGRSGKRNVSFGGEDVGGDGDAGTGLFSGPGGTLRNNTRKGRPAPAVQTSDVIDARAFSQESKGKDSAPEGVATPLASISTPLEKDVKRSGFDDDAWDVKPTKQVSQKIQDEPTQQSTAPPPAPSQPTLTGGMQELSLLSQPLEPVKAQPTAPSQATSNGQSSTQGPPLVAPSIFAGIGGQQTGLPPQQTGQLGTQFIPQTTAQVNISRQRPQPPQFQAQQSGLNIPAPPNRPLSAPQVQQSAFNIPPLQVQMTGMQTSTGFQNQVAPPGQSLEELRLRQQYTGFNNVLPNGPNMGYNSGNNFNNQQFNTNLPQNGFQYPMQTGLSQQTFPQQQLPQQLSQPVAHLHNGGGPFADPRNQQFSPIQAQPTGFQSSFGPPQQFSQPTGINAFLQPALQPQPTGVQPTQQNGMQPGFVAPPMPPIPQQSTTISPLVPQKTGPPPPVRFGVSGDTKKLVSQPTGRRANLAQATPQNPFGF